MDGFPFAKSSTSQHEDLILVRDLRARTAVGVDCWGREKMRDILLSVAMHFPVSQAAAADALAQTVNYSTLAKLVIHATEGRFESMNQVAEEVATQCLVQFTGLPVLTVRVETPRDLLFAAAAGCEITRGGCHSTNPRAAGGIGDRLYIKGLTTRTIIGVNPWERLEQQQVTLDMVFHLTSPVLPAEAQGGGEFMQNYRSIAHTVLDHIEASSYHTVEAMAARVAALCVCKCAASRVTVQVRKPSALHFARWAGVELTRCRTDYGGDKVSHDTIAALSTETRGVTARSNAPPTENSTEPQQATASAWSQPQSTAGRHVVYVGLGSNLGDRAGFIAEAQRKMQSENLGFIDNTSFLYESRATYLTDQPNFLNGVCRLRTELGATELLVQLKRIEVAMGRQQGERYGPRNIDLDILFYDALEVAQEQPQPLVIPHPRLHEREFVLRPMCDIDPSLQHVRLQLTVEQLLDRLCPQPPSTIARVLPLGPNHSWRWGERTYIMGVLNITPDSFSDGGDHLSVENAVEQAHKLVHAGADMIDIGGQSTRPGATEISSKEELDRVLPVIERLRSDPVTRAIPLSIDTYRAEVAAAALDAGVTLVNDISAGLRDPALLSVVQRHGAPVCLMHMCGDSRSMGLAQSQQYLDDDAVGAIELFLAARVTAALRAGISRWNILVDPGLGFAKRPERSMNIIRRLRDICRPGSILEGLPMLVGPSRKGFLQSAVGARTPTERVWATAAACTALVAHGADVLRVHDVAAMVDVARVADAVWRPTKKLRPDLERCPGE